LATHAPSEGGDPARAVTLAERACAQTGNSAFPYLDTLAAAYAAAGRFQEAVTTAQKAIELARAAGQTQAANEIAPRLELYRSAHAYREATNTPTSRNP
jgi:spermidine synthase